MQMIKWPDDCVSKTANHQAMGIAGASHAAFGVPVECLFLCAIVQVRSHARKFALICGQ